MSFVERRHASIYSLMGLNFALFGTTLTLIGAALPQILSEFHWSYTATGAVISAGAVGYFISTFLCGIGVSRFGPKFVVVSGLMIQAVGLALFAATPMVISNLLLQFLIGTGQGGTEVVVNFSVVRMEKSGQSRLMNLMHAAFSFGAIIGPFIVGKLAGAESNWRIIYRALALVSVIMAASMLFLPFSRLERDDAPGEKRHKNLHLLKHPMLILSFLILLLYVGPEMGISSWVAEYYVKVLKSTSSFGAYMVSLFWIGILIGRIGISFGYRGSRQPELLLALASICLVSLLFATLMRKAAPAGAGFFVAGLGYSAIYPVVITLVGASFPKSQSVAIGFTSTGGGIGAFAFPFVMAAISDRFGLKSGFFFFVMLNAAMAALAWAVIRQVRSKEAQASNGSL